MYPIMINNKPATYADTLAMGAYGFLIVLGLPSKLSTFGIDKQKVLCHYLEYNFTKLYWDPIGKGDSCYRHGFNIISQISKSDFLISMLDSVKAKIKVNMDTTVFNIQNEPSYLEEEDKFFKFIYFTTDNACLKVTNAYLIMSTLLVNYTTKEIFDNYYELQLHLDGSPLVGPGVTEEAQKFLNEINELTVFNDQSDLVYKAVNFETLYGLGKK